MIILAPHLAEGSLLDDLSLSHSSIAPYAFEAKEYQSWATMNIKIDGGGLFIRYPIKVDDGRYIAEIGSRAFARLDDARYPY